MKNSRIFDKKKLILGFFDILIINLAYFLALYFRFDMHFRAIPLDFLDAFKTYAIFNTIITLNIYGLHKMYNMILEYASYKELINITQAVILSLISHAVLMTIFVYRMPVSYYVFGFMIQYVLTVASRFIKKMMIHKSYKDDKKNRTYKRALIVGAGSAGQTLKRDISNSNNGGKTNILVVGFIDDDPNKKNQYIDNSRIFGGRDMIKEIVEEEAIDVILVAIPSVEEVEKREILRICNETGCEVKVLPGIYQLVSGKVTMSTMKDIQIEDLLGRDPVKIFSNETFDYLNDKVVLVTGGGGSIGSELCRQIAQYGPRLLIIFDIYENNAYEIEQELKRNNKDTL